MLFWKKTKMPLVAREKRWDEVHLLFYKTDGDDYKQLLEKKKRYIWEREL